MGRRQAAVLLAEPPKASNNTKHENPSRPIVDREHSPGRRLGGGAVETVEPTTNIARVLPPPENSRCEFELFCPLCEAFLGARNGAPELHRTEHVYGPVSDSENGVWRQKKNPRLSPPSLSGQFQSVRRASQESGSSKWVEIPSYLRGHQGRPPASGAGRWHEMRFRAAWSDARCLKGGQFHRAHPERSGPSRPAEGGRPPELRSVTTSQGPSGSGPESDIRPPCCQLNPR